MKLADYLDVTGLKQKDLAKLAGTSQATISALIVGRRHPSLTTAKKIAKATGNKVTVHELRPDWADAA